MFPVVLVIWIVVRGYDLGKWVRKKARKSQSESQGQSLSAGNSVNVAEPDGETPFERDIKSDLDISGQDHQLTSKT